MSVDKYLKTKKPKPKIKKYKQTGINIERYQHKIIEDKELNLSKMVRDFLDNFIEANYPEELDLSKIMSLDVSEDSSND